MNNKSTVIKSCFVQMGTDMVLKQQPNYFDFAAAFGVGILRLEDEDHDASACSILDCQKGRGKIRDMVLSSSQTTIRFFSKRTPCSCLDEMMSQVKGQVKMGVCIHCDKERECRKMYLCGACRVHQYCSKECQKQAWAEHKPECKHLCNRFLITKQKSRDENVEV